MDVFWLLSREDGFEVVLEEEVFCSDDEVCDTVKIGDVTETGIEAVMAVTAALKVAEGGR